tara:strand:+ start:606 stop:1649 length:1044 start_codon:yes stop_codon:yes gene_type:complete
MNLKLFCECNFFSENFEFGQNFKLNQQELIMKKHSNEKTSFEKKEVEYRCTWQKQKKWNNSLPTLIVPIKNNLKLLLITIKNLKNNNIDQKANIIIVDDRSEEEIKKPVLENNLSYLRVDNDKGFNFSMLNNIAAKICYNEGVKEIILWNSDLWCASERYFDILVKKHRSSLSKVSGSKLIYPPTHMSLNEDPDTDNIKSAFPGMAGKEWRETIQFGGPSWVLTPQSPIQISPIHYKRFSQPDDRRVNCDRGVSFITGALHIWDLKYFIKIGGLNPSLSRNFQDVDICLRACILGDIPMYFGKDIFFYHDESANFHSNKESKNNHQMMSDHVLFSKLWNEKAAGIVF